MTSLSITPFRAMLDRTLTDLRRTLTEAEDYLGGGSDLSAMGTLCDIDDQVADLKAAIRLYAKSRRTP